MWLVSLKKASILWVSCVLHMCVTCMVSHIYWKMRFHCKPSWVILQISLSLILKYKTKWNKKKNQGMGDLCAFLWGQNIFWRCNFFLLSSKGRKSWCIQLAQCDCFCHCSVIWELRELANLIFHYMFQYTSEFVHWTSNGQTMVLTCCISCGQR